MADIKVMIIDDSAVVRQVLTATLAGHSGIEVIGSAMDPLFALEKMAKQWPDVIVLDLEMPRMDGITFLKKLMSEHPTPVVVCSTLTHKGAEISIQALSAGAVSIITKPTIGLRQFLTDTSEDLVSSIKAAARANVGRLFHSHNNGLQSQKATVDVTIPVANHAMAQTTETVVALGTSTGGTQALEFVLSSLPEVCPGIVIVQHMPEKFTGAFAQRLNQLCKIEVREAHDGDRVLPGRALIAPGGHHMSLRRSGAQYVVEIVDGPPVNRHRPSVDVLFRSVAKYAGKNALGIIMTGMGNDGAHGLKEMRDAGAHTVAQNEETCVVYGMPKEAVQLGAVERILPIGDIPTAILGVMSRHR